jgi:hypothetical protein
LNQKASLYQTGIGFFDGGVVSDRVDAAITRAEEGAENPTNNADNDRSEKGIPEAIHLESRYHLRHKE